MADLSLPQMCECGSIMTRKILAPMVQGDTPPYQSPIDGKEVSGRRARKEDLLRNNCVEYEPGLKEAQMRAKAKSDEDLESAVESTLDQAITEMPARKRELLVQELSSGVDVSIGRRSP
jgi:hypothetical protein